MERRESQIGIIGMGAAGSMAGIFASRQGAKVAIFDGNEKLGKKIYITGKGRCNVTNATPMPEFLAGIARNPRFLYSALAMFSNQDLMQFFEKEGQSLKVERGERVFPVSDHASDIMRGLEKALRREQAHLYYHHRVRNIVKEEKGFRLFFEGDQEPFFVQRLILATGGKSYPSTGSTGDGARFAGAWGHQIIPMTPSLVPMVLKDAFISDWEGLSLRNVALTARVGKKKHCEFGEMLFTHDGISGPLVLTLSAKLSGLSSEAFTLSLDWKPALTEEKLRARLQREREQAPNRKLPALFRSFLPARVVPVFLQKGGWKENDPFHSWKREEERKFLMLLKNFPLTMKSWGSFSQAVVTRGGVSTKEVDPQTMASKLIEGLYFAGEVIDVDGFTGGYNLQIAFSTGALAGKSAAMTIAK